LDSDILNRLKDYTLLFVENEKGIRDNFTQYFELVFKKVYVAVDGVEALKLYKEHKPHLIITDIKMEKMDGIALTKEIRKDNKSIPIVIISAHTEVELLLQSIPLNLIDYIVKPLNQEKLTKIFKKFLELKEDQSFSYSYEKSEVFYDEKPHKLSLKENIFLNKILNENRIISYNEIELELWDGKEMSQNALRLFIKNLRKKLPKDIIKNIQNQGYCKK